MKYFRFDTEEVIFLSQTLKSHFLIYKQFTFFNPPPSVWIVDVLTKSPELRRCQTPWFPHLKKTYSYEALTAQTLLASSNSVLNITKEKWALCLPRLILPLTLVFWWINAFFMHNFFYFDTYTNLLPSASVSRMISMFLMHQQVQDAEPFLFDACLMSFYNNK